MQFESWHTEWCWWCIYNNIDCSNCSPNVFPLAAEILSDKFYIVWLSACLSESPITQSCVALTSHKTVHNSLSLSSFFKVKWKYNFRIHFLQQGQVSLQRWISQCLCISATQQIAEMVSMAWKISHLLLYIHKYTEDYLLSCGKVLQSSNFNFYIAGKNSLAIQDFIFIFIFFLIAIFTLPIIALSLPTWKTTSTSKNHLWHTSHSALFTPLCRSWK